jgi:hypothetical protein
LEEASRSGPYSGLGGHWARLVCMAPADRCRCRGCYEGTNGGHDR